jgi:hypothetical protein
VRSGGGKRMNQLDVRGNDEPATSFKKRSKDRMNGHWCAPTVREVHNVRRSGYGGDMPERVPHDVGAPVGAGNGSFGPV